jgi:hypothetical protein
MLTYAEDPKADPLNTSAYVSMFSTTEGSLKMLESLFAVVVNNRGSEGVCAVWRGGSNAYADVCGRMQRIRRRMCRRMAWRRQLLYIYVYTYIYIYSVYVYM